MIRIVPHTVPRVGRSYEHFPDGFELHLLAYTLAGRVSNEARVHLERRSEGQLLRIENNMAAMNVFSIHNLVAGHVSNEDPTSSITPAAF